MQEEKMIAYKGFDKNLCCIGFQYEVGKEYFQLGEIECCKNGFHACLNPLDVLNYYEVDKNTRFCVVEQSGIISVDSEDTKQASSKIKIIAEIGMAGLFEAAVEWIKEKTNPIPVIEITKKNGRLSNSFNAHVGSSFYNAMIGSSGEYAHISSSGEDTHIGSIGNDAQIGSSGDHTRIGSRGFEAQIGSSGDFDKIGSSGSRVHIGSSGYNAVIGSSGEFAHIGSSGNSAQIGSSGNFARISSSGRNVQIGSSGNLARISSSGDYSHIGSSGNFTRISSSGDFAQIESSGERSVICCAGNDSIAKAKKGSWITLAEWVYLKEKGYKIPRCVKTEYVDGRRIKEDTWYKLVNGKFVELDKYAN